MWDVAEVTLWWMFCKRLMKSVVSSWMTILTLVLENVWAEGYTSLKNSQKTRISCPIKVLWFDTEKLRGGVY